MRERERNRKNGLMDDIYIYEWGYTHVFFVCVYLKYNGNNKITTRFNLSNFGIFSIQSF